MIINNYVMNKICHSFKMIIVWIQYPIPITYSVCDVLKFNVTGLFLTHVFSEFFTVDVIMANIGSFNVG